MILDLAIGAWPPVTSEVGNGLPRVGVKPGQNASFPLGYGHLHASHIGLASNDENLARVVIQPENTSVLVHAQSLAHAG